MATIEKRTNGTFRVKVRKAGQHVSASFPTKRLAQQWARKVETELAENAHLPAAQARKRTLGEVIARYRETELADKRPNTIRLYKTHFTWWEQRLGATVLANITPDVIEDCKHELVGIGRKRTTVHAYLRSLSVLLKKARRWKWLVQNPLDDVDKPSLRGTHRVRFLDDDERKRLLDVCGQSQNRYLLPIAKLALFTGMRKTELLTLKWDCVDLRRGVIRLTADTKTHEPRTVPLSQPARDVLRELAKVRNIHGWVFPSAKEPSKPAGIRTAWQEAVKRAGIDNLVFHDLRHSCASYIIQNGGTLADVAAILGHSSINMASRYAHLADDTLQRTAELVAARVTGE